MVELINKYKLPVGKFEEEGTSTICKYQREDNIIECVKNRM
jgi:hypothetical protein